MGKESLSEALQGTRLKPSAVCFGSLKGDLVSEDEAKRGKASRGLETRVDLGRRTEIGGRDLLPAFNGQTKLANQEIRQILLDKLPELTHTP